MENYDKALQYTETALNSAGTAEQKFQAYTEGVESKMNSLKSAAEGFAKAFIDSGIITGILDLSTVLVNLSASPITMFLLKSTLMFAALKGLRKGFLSLTKHMKNAQQGASTLTKIIAYLREGETGLGKVLAKTQKDYLNLTAAEKQSIIADQKKIISSAAVNAAIAGISLVIMAGISIYQKYKQSQEEAIEKAKELSETINQEKDQLLNLREEYINLKNSETQDDSTRKSIQNIQQQIVDLVGEEAEQIDLVNGGLEEQLKKLDKISYKQAQAKLTGEGNGELGNSAELLRQQLGDSIVGLTDSWSLGFIKSDFSALIDWFKKNKPMQEMTNWLQPAQFGGYGDVNLNQAKEILQYWKDIRSEMSAANDKQSYQAVTNIIDTLTERIDNYKKAIDTYTDTLAIAAIGNQKFNHGLKIDSQEAFNAAINSVENSIEKWIDPNTELVDIEEAQSAIIEALKQQYPEYAGVIEDSTQASEQQLGAILDLNETLTNTIQLYNELISIVKDYNDDGYITAENFSKLIELMNKSTEEGFNYLQYLIDENGQIINNTSALETYMQAMAQQQALESSLSYVKKMLALDEAEFAKTQKQSLQDILAYNNGLAQQIMLLVSTSSWTTESKKQLLNYVEAIVNSASAIQFNTSSTSKATDAQDKYNDSIKYATNLLNDQIDALEKQKEALEEENELLEQDIDTYDKTLSYINKIIDAKIKALEDEKKALEDKNEEKERELELEELEQNLAKAKQKTMRVYYADKGWVWQSDPAAVKEAEEALEDFKNEEEINKIDEEIENWQDYQEQWQNIADVYEDYLDEMAFKSQQHLVTEQDILNKRVDALENFKTEYFNIQQQIANNKTEIEDLQRKIDKYQKQIDMWNTIPDNYEKSSIALNEKMLAGAENREAILNGDINLIKNFQTQYNNAMKNVAETTESYSGRINNAIGKIDFSKMLNEPQGTIKYAGKIADFNFENVKGMFSGEDYLTNGTFVFKKSDLKRVEGGYTYKAGTPYYSMAFASGTKNSPAGLANIDEKGSELVIPPPSKGRYRMLEAGTGVLPHNLTQRIFDVATNPLKYISNALNSIKTPILNNSYDANNTKMTQIDIHNITMPNSINNADSFVKQLQIISANR